MDDENDDVFQSDWGQSENGEDDDRLDLAERIVDGSFMPAIVAIEKGLLVLD